MENIEQEQEKEPKESNQQLIEILKEFLKDTNLEKIVKSLNEGKKDDNIVKKEHNTNNLKFWSRRFLKESVIVLFILVTIISLSLMDKIENNTLGTLLGSVIGYAIGNFSSSNKN
ncbi:hypothetical protein [uncultured Maribacter sp.]|uniref:hypothetical protein n=1 Tax=uncultured Maribacter sp. TaxID=431308 RepID=UPI0030EDAC73